MFISLAWQRAAHLLGYSQGNRSLCLLTVVEQEQASSVVSLFTVTVDTELMFVHFYYLFENFTLC